MANEVTIVIKSRDQSGPGFDGAANRGKKLKSTLLSVGQSMTSVGKKMTRAITVPAVAAGAAGIKMAVDYQSSMQKINGLVGISQRQVDGWSKQILSLGKTLPQSPKELADAMFFITSAGLRGKTALDALTASARASAAGLGDTTTVADAVTSAMNAYGSQNLSAAKATDILTAAVREGKLEASALAPVIGRVVPLASELGVSFDQVSAGMAALSRTGADASEAATGVSAILRTMITESPAGAAALKKVGLSYSGIRQELKEKGLLETLFHVRDAFGGNVAKMRLLFQDSEALKAVLGLTGKQANETRGIFERMAHSTGSADKAFASAAKTADFKLHKALAQLQDAAIKMANAFLPTVTKIAAGLTSLMDKFQALPGPVKAAAKILAVGLVVGGPALLTAGRLVTAYATVAKAIRSAAKAQAVLNAVSLSNPYVAAAAAIIAVGIAFTIAWKKSQAFRDIMTSVAVNTGQVFIRLGQVIVMAVLGAFNAIVQIASKSAGLFDLLGMHGVADNIRNNAKKIQDGINKIGASFDHASDKLEGFQERSKRGVQIKADLKDLNSKLATAYARLKTVSGKTATAKIKANIADLESKYRQGIVALGKLNRTTATSKMKGHIADLQAKVAAAKRALNTVPRSRQAQLKAYIAQLQAQVRAARAALASVRSKTVYINGIYRGMGDAIRASKATGGVVGAQGGGPRSRMTLVGEQGPELADLAPGTMVHSNADTRRILSQSGGRPYVVQVNLQMDGKMLASVLFDPLKNVVRQRGGKGAGSAQKAWGYA